MPRRSAMFLQIFGPCRCSPLQCRLFLTRKKLSNPAAVGLSNFSAEKMGWHDARTSSRASTVALRGGFRSLAALIGFSRVMAASMTADSLANRDTTGRPGRLTWGCGAA